MKIIYFSAPADLRAWFKKHHASAAELHAGFHKKSSGVPSITWPESVDEALCVGWIDGVRRNVDEMRYTIRFTPRRPRSIWSAINIKRVEVLTGEARMRPAGLDAFAARTENKSGIYSYEQREAALPEAYAKKLKQHKAAAAFFEAQPPGYRKQMMWRIVSAKREETRLKRLATLIDACAKGRRLS